MANINTIKRAFYNSPFMILTKTSRFIKTYIDTLSCSQSHGEYSRNAIPTDKQRLELATASENMKVSFHPNPHQKGKRNQTNTS